MKQNLKNDKIEENMKYLTKIITDRENRSRRDNLRIIFLPEKSKTNKNLDIMLQEIIQENCPGVLKQEGKIDIKRAHRIPSTLNPQKTTPRHVIAKSKDSKLKRKYYKKPKRDNSDTKEHQ